MNAFNVFRRLLQVRRPLHAGAGVVVSLQDGFQDQAPTIYDESGIALDVVHVNLSILASVQPANGEKLLTLPENRRDVESYILYTSTELQTQDIIEINGKDFEVHMVDVCQNNIINHYAYMVQKVMT